MLKNTPITLKMQPLQNGIKILDYAHKETIISTRKTSALWLLLQKHLSGIEHFTDIGIATALAVSFGKRITTPAISVLLHHSFSATLVVVLLLLIIEAIRGRNEKKRDKKE